MDGLVCLQSVCRLPATLGDPCNDTNTPCEQTAQCVEGDCVPLAQVGDECSPTFTPIIQCDSGLVCDDGRCVAIALAEVGEPCGSVDSVFTLCHGRAACDPGTELCEPLKDEGEMCEPTFTAPCRTGLVCLDGTCQSLTCGP